MFKLDKKIRWIYYSGSIILLILTALSLSIPAYTGIKSDLEIKIDQLSEGIINQKKILLKTIIVEKISDISQRRENLRIEKPTLNNEEFDQEFRREIRNMIHRTELPDNGYIWINEIFDYQGGDNYAIRFAHPNLMQTEGDFLSTSTNDIVGNLPYLEELEGIKANKEVFFDYFFKKKDSDVISHKLSYAKLYKPYNWVVATGVYLDDLDRLVEGETEMMKSTSMSSLRTMILTIIAASLFFIGMLILFERRIQAVLNRYLSALEKSNSQIKKEKGKLEQAYKKIENLAYTDFLTGLWNRRAIDDRMKREISRTTRESSSFGIIMCDIDHFKNVNDSYGHDAGDYILKTVAGMINDKIRIEDSASRWGGEEFLLMIVHVDMKQTMSVAEKLRSTIENSIFEYQGNKIKLTITAGVSVYQPDCEIEDILRAADAKLYRGKETGRNQVIGK